MEIIFLFINRKIFPIVQRLPGEAPRRGAISQGVSNSSSLLLKNRRAPSVVILVTRADTVFHHLPVSSVLRFLSHQPGLLRTELLLCPVCVLHKRPHSPTDTSAEGAMKDPSVGDSAFMSQIPVISLCRLDHIHIYTVLYCKKTKA